MDPAKAAPIRAKAATGLIQALFDLGLDSFQPMMMGDSTGSFLSTLAPPDAATVCRQVLAALPKILADSTKSGELDINNLSPDGFAQNIARIKLFTAVEALAAAAKALDPKEAAVIGPAAVSLFAEGLKKKGLGALTIAALRKGRTSMSVHLKSSERSAELVQELVTAADDASVAVLTEDLVTSAIHLSPADAATASDHLLTRLSQSASKGAAIDALPGLGSQGFVPVLINALKETVARLEPQAASAICVRAAKILVQALNKGDAANNATVIAAGLTALADRLPPADASVIAEQLQSSLAKAEIRARRARLSASPRFGGDRHAVGAERRGESL